MKKSSIFTLSLIAASTNVLAEKYVPIVSTPVYLESSKLTCRQWKTPDSKEITDWCDASASVHVRVNVEQMRSIASVNQAGKTTPDAKMVRFIVDEDTGGTGIHLVDELKQGNYWFESWAHRYTYIGPFVDSYDLWVKPVNGYKPNKIKDFPRNENKNYEHREAHGVSIGVNGTAGSEVGGDGPKSSSQVGGSFSISNEKTLVFNTKEYEIVNKSSLSNFEVSFKRALTSCEEMYRETLSCAFWDALWGSGFVFDKRKFSPIAYANFKPNYEVVYEAPVSQKGRTDFELGIRFNFKVRFGSVLPSPIWAVYSPYGEGVGSSSVIKQKVRIDWDHPLFSPEAHVSLQSLSTNNLCLDVNSNNKDVSGAKCLGGWDQIWGLDKKERYHSRSAPDRCLAVMPDKTVAVDDCNNSLAQKWVWQNGQLTSRYADGTNNSYVLNIIEGDKIGVIAAEKADKSKWKPILHKIKL